jgi:glycogen(starch) synthase
VHATEFDRAGENGNPEVYAIERTGMEEADRIIAVSYLTRDRIISRYQIPEEKVVVVHNGIGPSTLTEPVVEPPIGKKIVTYLGRVTYQKGPQYFIEAARKVARKFPDVHFVMAGSGDMLAEMIERVARLKLSSRFHFTGFLRDPEVERIWSITHVYVMPSVSEPFGIAPLEAIRAGVPVILSRQSGVSEVIQNAIKVDFWDTDSLAGAICNVLKFKSLSDTLSSKSSAELRKVTWDIAAKKVIKLYHELSTQETISEPVFSDTPAEAVGAV